MFCIENICHFLPKTEADINILNFVYETNPQIAEKEKCETVHKLHLVIRGKGKLHINGAEYELKKGDAFFLFPSVFFSLESLEEFEYIYIILLGARANAVMEKINIDKKNFIFRDAERLIPLWTDSITDDKTIMSLRCEGLLLYSFSFFGEQIAEARAEDDAVVPRVKLFIDEHYTDRTLTVKKISAHFAYSEKYLSSAFKKQYHIGISAYIAALRNQFALSLMEQGYTSVQNIALRSGFSEPLYFSKVFRKMNGVSPRTFIESKKKMQNISSDEKRSV